MQVTSHCIDSYWYNSKNCTIAIQTNLNAIGVMFISYKTDIEFELLKKNPDNYYVVAVWRLKKLKESKQVS